jgi:hypothetical protein
MVKGRIHQSIAFAAGVCIAVWAKNRRGGYSAPCKGGIAAGPPAALAASPTQGARPIGLTLFLHDRSGIGSPSSLLTSLQTRAAIDQQLVPDVPQADDSREAAAEGAEKTFFAGDADEAPAAAGPHDPEMAESGYVLLGAQGDVENEDAGADEAELTGSVGPLFAVPEPGAEAEEEEARRVMGPVGFLPELLHRLGAAALPMLEEQWFVDVLALGMGAVAVLALKQHPQAPRELLRLFKREAALSAAAGMRARVCA